VIVKVPCILQGIQRFIQEQNTDVQYHFIREVVEDESVDFQKVHTKENPADALTKLINTNKYVWCRSSYGLTET